MEYVCFWVVLQSRSVPLIYLSYGIELNFQPDCAPNVRKVRNNRALCFFTTRDVEVGEELCINYIDVKDQVLERRAELASNWYFDCACKRCGEELAQADGVKFQSDPTR